MKKIFLYMLLMPAIAFGQQFSRIQISADPNDNISVSFSSSYRSSLFQNKLYFIGFSQIGDVSQLGLWVTDGTSQGTHFLTSFTTQGQSAQVFMYSNQNHIFISGRDTDPNEPFGVELWISDGTEAGTKQLKDIVQGPDGSWPTNFVSMGSDVFFLARNTLTHLELWKTDGTESGTIMISPINVISPFYDGMNTLYFNGDDAVHGKELWKTDGTVNGTTMVKDIISGPGGADPRHFTTYNGLVYFSAWVASEGGSGSGRRLLVTDGTEAGTQVVKDIRPTSNPDVKDLYVSNGLLFFSANDGTHGQELWATDGSEQGTYMVKDIRPGSGGGMVIPGFIDPKLFLGEIDNELFFIAHDGTHGGELWKTDGTAEGTVLVKDIFPGPDPGNIQNPIMFNNKIYFSAKSEATGYKIFETDGTESGTIPFAPHDATKEYPLDMTGRFNAAVLDDALIFLADFYDEGDEKLWRYGDPITSTSQLTQKTFHLYPNPATNHLSIGFRKMYSDVALEIHNINGQLIERKKLQSVQQHDLNVSQWSKGLYVISVISDEGVVNEKFIKQ